jgi:hypothetical protein
LLSKGYDEVCFFINYSIFLLNKGFKNE